VSTVDGRVSRHVARVFGYQCLDLVVMGVVGAGGSSAPDLPWPAYKQGWRAKSLGHVDHCIVWCVCGAMHCVHVPVHVFVCVACG
jgi:hypothetical protein